MVHRNNTYEKAQCGQILAAHVGKGCDIDEICATIIERLDEKFKTLDQEHGGDEPLQKRLPWIRAQVQCVRDEVLAG